jgi:hypothetical protein
LDTPVATVSTQSSTFSTPLPRMTSTRWPSGENAGEAMCAAGDPSRFVVTPRRSAITSCIGGFAAAVRTTSVPSFEALTTLALESTRNARAGSRGGAPSGMAQSPDSHRRG